MKNVLLFLFIFTTPLFAQDYSFVHPLDFRDTEADRDRVLRYIVSNVQETYSKIGMDNPTTLRMMEKEELKAFKDLTKVSDRALLDRVIKTYCDIGMCTYSTILMMYNEESKASDEELKW